MRVNKIWSILAMLVLVLSTTVILNSCGKDSEDGNNNDDHPSTIVDGIDSSLIPGVYEFNGNIAPSFSLFKDGTCEIRSNGHSSSITPGKWTYEKNTHVLLVGTYVYTIKMLTKESLVAEWTSVKYGTSVSSWVRTNLPSEGTSDSENEVSKINGHDAVDLGLTVKWATMNIGAATPEGYGEYFAWGETKSKDVYEWRTYMWCNGSYRSQTKYCTDSSYGKVDNKTMLDSEDDAATANWGKQWRMPTRDEMDELQEKCTWTWTTRNGVNGYLVQSATNGNFIFLPACGERYGSEIHNGGTCGNYWLSSLGTSGSNDACTLFFKSDRNDWGYSSRYHGLSVRAVCP